MPVLNAAADLAAQAVAWRHHLHAHPELMFDVHETGDFIAARLKEFGCDEIVRGLGRTGVVGVINGRGDGPVIGLRSDMDALPIREVHDHAYKSTRDGKMHACGHDGHMAMLLGAARHLCETRNFSGRVVVIFQPAEEGGGGGREMVEDGLMERFGIDRVYGMHNMPGIAPGHFAIAHGPLFAATDEFRITVTGRGGHAAMPHQTVDPVVVSAAIVQGLQTIASRNADPLASVVVSVTVLQAGHAHNVIPATADLGGTVRTLTPETRTMAEDRLKAIASGIAQAYGAQADTVWSRGYPVTINRGDETDLAAQAARDIAGDGCVDPAVTPIMGGEDFAYMLEARPGAMILIGNGDTPGLHHPEYDFNDTILPAGISYWVRLVERESAR